MLDMSAHGRLHSVGPSNVPPHPPSFRLAPMDAADLADPGAIALVLGGPVGAVGPNARRRVIGVDQTLAQPRTVMRRRVGDLRAADMPSRRSMQMCGSYTKAGIAMSISGLSLSAGFA
jgi:hypothetical protein